MTPSARIQATFEILQEIAETPRPADSLVSAYFRARRFIGSHDRSAIATRLYSILRHHARLAWWLEKSGTPFSPRTQVLAWLALGENLKLKVIGELCSGGKYAPEELDESERIFLRKLDGGTLEHPDMPEEVLAECPIESFAPLKKKFGKNFMREMRAMQEPATLDLRVNSLKATREEILVALKELGLNAKPCSLSPWGVRVYERPSLSSLSMLKNGLVEIQDEGSQMVALVTGAKPGERVVDFCAGAGGKTLAIGAMMQNKGRILACDVLERRLQSSTERFRRAGLHNIEIRAMSSERDPWVKKHAYKKDKSTGFDCVLTDAPCSGTGTWRRNPDARWRELGPGLEKLLKLQAEILDSAARLVKPEGRLVYATCSFLPSENEEQIDKFLAAHPDFKLSPCGLDGAPYLSLTPAQYGTDGFFTAVMVKAKAAD